MLTTPSGIKDPAKAVAMLEDAAKETIQKYGTLDRPFGDVSRFHWGTYNLPGNGGYGNIGIFRVITWSPLKNARKNSHPRRNLYLHGRVLEASEGNGNTHLW